jgi:hypothetical protein
MALAALLLTAAAGATIAGATIAPALPCHPEWPVATYRATTGSVQPATSTRVPVPCATATGYATSETTLAVSGAGAIYFSPSGSENSLGVSTDGGTSWSLAQPGSMQPTSLWNTVDPQVVLDRRTGRLFWVHTTHSLDLRGPLPDQSVASWLVPTAVANAHGFQVYSTGDGGRSWTTADYQYENTADWEKLFLGPAPPASTGAAQPSGYPNVVYVCANAPLEVIGIGRSCYRSLDGGRTFSFAGYVDPSATAPAGCPALAANTGVVSSSGTLYIPQSCAGATYLARSTDEGASYSWLPVQGAPPASTLGATVQLAIDRGGDLYLLWTAGDQLRMIVSRDGALTWSAPLTVSAPGLHNITLPALAAGPRGAVGVVYYASTDPSAKTLSAYISTTTQALRPEPLFFSGVINDPAHPIYENYGEDYTPRADFLGATFDGAGRFWGGVVDQLGAPDESNSIPTSGYVGRLDLVTQTTGVP